DFFTWDMRVSKDFKFGERYALRLSADLYNVTNRANLYSNPDNTGFVSLPGATTTPITGPTAGCTPIPNSITLSCPALTAIPKQGDTFTLINPTPGGQNVTFRYGVRDEISPGSTPFAAQFGVRFQF